MSHSSDISSAYQKLNAKADKLYEFAILYHDYIYTYHTYENENLSMLEIHTLIYIEDSPGITATELAEIWYRSKSAIFQAIKKLMDSGYVEKRYKENNEKSVCLYVTEKGQRLSSIHKAYDVADITQTISYPIEQCGEADLDASYRIIETHNKPLKFDLESQVYHHEHIIISIPDNLIHRTRQIQIHCREGLRIRRSSRMSLTIQLAPAFRYFFPDS